MEQKTEVKTYRVHYICDFCQKGKMRPTGLAYLTSPARYPHVCDKCGKSQTFDQSYPTIRHEPVGNEK